MSAVTAKRSAAGSPDAPELLRAATRQLDKAASKGVIHANQAANRKSALAKQARSPSLQLVSVPSLRHLPVSLRLQREQLRVAPTARQQLLVAADLGRPAGLDVDDQIGHPHGRKSVRNQHRDRARRLPHSA